ncbi:MAG: trigger factor [Mogibacterium sp.]|nr:trigger factor [Mogibacterium sp.]
MTNFANKRAYRLAEALLIAVMGIMLTACGTKAQIPNEYNYGDFSEYIKLADYKGIEYTKITGDVSEEEVRDYIDGRLSASDETEQINEGKVEADSIVNIDYVGSIDGVEFEGGTAQGADLDIANSGYIPGFAEGIIGHEVGETFDLHVTFPDDYGKEELQGKPAVFKTTINYLVIKKKAEFNDEWVKNNSDYSTTAEYEDFARKQIAEDKLSQAESNEKNEVFGKIVEASEVVKYPEKELASRTEQVKKIYMEYAKSSGMELDEFISSQMGMDTEQFNSMADESAKNTVKSELILHAIKNAESVETKQGGYEAFLSEMLENAGFTEESFKEQNGKTIAEYANENGMYTSYLYNEVMNKVMEYSVGK